MHRSSVLHISRLIRWMFLCLLISSITPSLHGQIVQGFGIKAGLTSSDIHPTFKTDGERPLIFDTKRRRGLGIFAFVEWFSPSSVSLLTEAGYIQRGFATEHGYRDAQNNPAGTIRLDNRFDYLSFSTLVKLRGPDARVVPYVMGGPRLDLFLGGTPDEEGTLASSYASTAIGGTLGVGVEFQRLLPFTLFAEARYTTDFTNSLPDVPRDAYNNAFDVLLGFRW